MSYMIGVADLEDIALGASLLGSGGGGDPYIGRLVAQHALVECDTEVTVVTVDELQDDDFVIPTGGMGSPSIGIERPRSGRETAWALQALEQFVGRRASATMPVECGGANSLSPITTAAYLDIPIVDADGMGRAFPELQMETFGIEGIRTDPMALATEHRDTVVLRTDIHDNERMEWLARGEVVRMGGNASMAIYPMTGKQVRQTAIPGTLTLCRELGRAIRRSGTEHMDPLSVLHGIFASRHQAMKMLCEGKIIDVLRRNDRGFVMGNAVIQSFSGGQHYLLSFQNENLALQRCTPQGDPGDYVCTVPDLLIVVDDATAEPLTTQMLRYGQRVKVLGIAAAPQLRTPKALEVVGPRAFGLDTDYHVLGALESDFR